MTDPEELYHRHSAAFAKLHASEREDELVEAALEAFAHASGLGIFPDEDDKDWRDDLWNGMRAALAAARPVIRNEALEEAARAMLTKRERWWPDVACAAIRALKEETE